MKLIDKHIVKEFIPPLFYCIAIFICLYVIIDLFANLDDIIKQHVGFKILLRYYLAFLPIIFTQITPIAVLLSVLYSLGNLNHNNEIMAMKASGISILRIITPLLFLGLIISLISFIVDNRIVPQAYLIYNNIKEEKIESPENNKEKIVKDIALYGADRQIFYAESYNQDTETLNIITILKHNEEGALTHRITSDKAQWSDDKWIFYNYYIYPLDRSGAMSEAPLTFKEKVLRLQERPEDFSKSKHQTQFMSILDLYKHIKRLSKNGYRPLGLIVDLNNKISFPFINLIVILIGMPFALLPNKSGAFMYVGASVFISFLYYAILIISISLGKTGFLPAALSSWFANMIFASAGIIFLIKIPK